MDNLSTLPITLIFVV